MSFKIDSLLEKATTFERLALYGDRQTFLQALSQHLPRVVVPAPGGGGQWLDPNPAAPHPKPNSPAPLPRLVQPAPGGGGEWFDPNAALEEPRRTERDPNILLQKQLNAPAVREQERTPPKAVVPHENQLIDALNTWSSKAAGMNDAQKDALLRKINDTTLAPLVGILQQIGGYDNPYATAHEQALAQQIRAAVNAFGQAFSSRITEAPNYARLA